MQIAFVVDVRDARRERVGLGGADLSYLGCAGGLEQRIVGHHRFPARLPVDRPVGPVIVRRRMLRALVVMRENAKSEPRVFIDDLAIAGRIGEVLVDERLVGQYLFEKFPDLLAPRRTGLGGQQLVAGRGKLFEGVYALYSGFVVLAAASLVLAPVLHRFLHKLHLDDQG